MPFSTLVLFLPLLIGHLRRDKQQMAVTESSKSMMKTESSIQWRCLGHNAKLCTASRISETYSVWKRESLPTSRGHILDWNDSEVIISSEYAKPSYCDTYDPPFVKFVHRKCLRTNSLEHNNNHSLCLLCSPALAFSIATNQIKSNAWCQFVCSVS